MNTRKMVTMKKCILLFALLINVLCINVAAAQTFVIKRISIEGLQRVNASTVESYLPVHVGQTLTPEKTGAIISALYKTGFFEHISLARDGNTLIIRVVERSTIGKLKISGNSAIATDKLTGVMKSVDIAEGRAYNSVVLEKIKQSLLNQYYQLGRYNARVDVSVTPMGRNRVQVNIDISEGVVAKVRKINIIGNHTFSDSKLLKQFDLTTPGLLTFFTQTDRYSQDKLDSSMEKIRNYYLDRGYLKVSVKSSQAAITPDRKSIFLTIVIDEGTQYTVKGVNVIGQTVVPREELIKRLNIQPGSTFSRQAVVDGEKAVSDVLGNEGYAFASITLEPVIDEKNKQVFLTFVIKSGKRVYVRHISFSDNSKTNDEVLRRELQQMESAPVSTARLDESKHRLSLLPYIRDVQMNVEPVANEKDKVDVNYKVTEDNSANATFSIGYSQLDHIILGAGLNQKNFLGTGNTLGINFTRSRYQQFYGMSYTNPYFTQDGIQRSLSISAAKYNPKAAGITRSYNDDQYSISDIYSIPISQQKGVINRVQLGYGYENTFVNLSHTVSQQVQSFADRHGRHFQQIDLIAGVSRDSRDKAIFPTTGMINTLGFNYYVPANSKSLNYYTFSYDGKMYQPIAGPFIGTLRGDFGYGNAFGGATNYPFFKNFYAGGPDSVRGFTSGTLGPTDSIGDPSGGNMLAYASAALIFPNYISDNLRTSLFVDAGNVYNTFNNRRYNGTGSGPARYSTGIEGDWLTPLGLVDVSFARALNSRPGDDLDFFQFSLGANFG